MKTQEVWRTLCAHYETDPLLKGVEPQHQIHFLELFGQGYRTGDLSKSGHSVRSHTVEAALGDVGALFTDLGLPDPRHQPGTGRYVPMLKRWLVGLQKQDPPSSRTYPCSVSILRALFRLPTPTLADTHARDLAVVGFFYMNRPGEVVHTTNTDAGRSSPFRLTDVSFMRGKRRLDVGTAHTGILNDENPSKKQRTLSGCTAATLTYSDQKNCHKGESVTHVPTGDPDLCPVRALERIVTRLLQHCAPLNTPLHDFHDGPPPDRKAAPCTAAKPPHCSTAKAPAK